MNLYTALKPLKFVYKKYAILNIQRPRSVYTANII